MVQYDGGPDRSRYLLLMFMMSPFPYDVMRVIIRTDYDKLSFYGRSNLHAFVSQLRLHYHKNIHSFRNFHAGVRRSNGHSDGYMYEHLHTSVLRHLAISHDFCLHAERRSVLNCGSILSQ